LSIGWAPLHEFKITSLGPSGSVNTPFNASAGTNCGPVPPSSSSTMPRSRPCPMKRKTSHRLPLLPLTTRRSSSRNGPEVVQRRFACLLSGEGVIQSRLFRVRVQLARSTDERLRRRDHAQNVDGRLVVDVDIFEVQRGGTRKRSHPVAAK